ncbi:MAG: hypothetical protein KME45_00810 [Stenomitos rutilans HA7619-LM2]|jgi:hypothetical protein|nr:hypothetical protein [Stenomitos rutilans HA7619-LM2]
MICTPLLTSYSAPQQRPHSEWSLAIALFGAKGVSARFRGNLLQGNALHTGVLVTGMTKTLAELQIIDRPTQSGWCRRGLAPT